MNHNDEKAKLDKARRQQVEDTVATVSPWDLSGSPEGICQELRETQDAYLKGYDNIIEASWRWVEPLYDGISGYFALIITRLENDREYNARVKRLMQIKKNEKTSQEKEYEEYLRLKQKFENDWNDKTVEEVYGDVKIVTQSQFLNEMIKLVPSGNFQPYAYYNADMDSIQVYFKDEHSYTQPLNQNVEIHLSHDTDEITGATILNIKQLIESKR